VISIRGSGLSARCRICETEHEVVRADVSGQAGSLALHSSKAYAPECSPRVYPSVESGTFTLEHKEVERN
jgi:hypothetical protein